MKLIDHNGRLFGKISVIDVLVLAVVALMAVALSVKNTSTHAGTAVPEQTITYTLLVSSTRNYLADSIQVGDLLFDKDHSSGGSIGTITDIQILPATVTAELNDGSIKNVPAEDSVGLLLTIEGKGLSNDDGSYFLNRVYSLGVNSARNYYTKYALFTGVVTEING